MNVTFAPNFYMHVIAKCKVVDMYETNDISERAGIMHFCGKVPKLEALRLARTRPWETEPYWEIPKPQQLDLMGKHEQH